MVEVENKLKASYEMSKGCHDVHRRKLGDDPTGEQSAPYLEKSKKRLSETLQKRKALKIAENTQQEHKKERDDRKLIFVFDGTIEAGSRIRWLIDNNFMLFVIIK